MMMGTQITRRDWLACGRFSTSERTARPHENWDDIARLQQPIDKQGAMLAHRTQLFFFQPIATGNHRPFFQAKFCLSCCSSLPGFIVVIVDGDGDNALLAAARQAGD